MTSVPLYLENVRWRWLSLSLVTSLLGAAAIYWSSELPNRWSATISGLGVAVISAGVIGFGYELTLRRAVVRESLDAAGLSTSLAATGILEVSTFGSIDWRDFFASTSGDIQICVSYGQSWAGSHAHAVVARASETNSRVKVTLLDPNAPNHILDFYRHTFSMENRSTLLAKINEAVDIWKAAESSVGGSARLEIEGLQRPIPYTYYRSGDSMWVVFVPRKPGRTGPSIPAFRCVRTNDSSLGLFDWVEEDLEACRRARATRTIWSSDDD